MPRRVLLRALCLLTATGFVSHVDRGVARADSNLELVFVVDAENPSSAVSREFLADAYLKRATLWGDGETIHPVDQRADSAVRRTFSENVLKRSVAAVKRYWQQRIFSGRELPPPELEGDAAVIGYVIKHRGALGYVSSKARPDGVKILPLR